MRLSLGADELGSYKAWRERMSYPSAPSLPQAEWGRPKAPASGVCQQAAVPALPHPGAVPSSSVPLEAGGG